MLCITIQYRELIGLGWGGRLFFSLVNIFVIFANQTRGAILGLLAVLLYLLLIRAPRRWRLAIGVLMLGATIGIGELATLSEGTPLTKVLGRDAEAMGAVLGNGIKPFAPLRKRRRRKHKRLDRVLSTLDSIKLCGRCAVPWRACAA